MQTFHYPQSDLDKGKELLRVLGTFWSSTFQAQDQIASYTQAAAEAAKQNQLNLLEAVAALSRFDVPVFHTENWYPITLRKSQLNKTAANVYKFDTPDLEFDANSYVTFDGAAQTNLYAFPVDTKLAAACHIFDRILFPTVDLIGGSDFKVDRQNGAIVFIQNPFELPAIPRTPVYAENNALVDEIITLWAFRANLDYGYIFRQFAYAVNIQLESSENAKQLVNAIFDGLIAGGATVHVINAALSAIFDIPVVKEDGEIVEVMARDRNGSFIATNKHVYRFADTAIPIVAVDQVLRAGDRLVDAFDVIELNRGVVPDTFAALALDQNFTSYCYYADLIFENREVPLRVITDHPSGYTYVDFPLSGFPADVAQFFNDVHERGIKLIPPAPEPCKLPNGQRSGTLAHVLDRRTNPIGEPAADDLPATINPLRFLVNNVLRNHAMLVTVKVAEMGKNHLSLYNIRHLRQLFPPYAGMFIVYNLGGLADSIDGENTLGEELTVFKGANPLADSVLPEYVRDKGVIVRLFSGTCE